MRHEISFLKIIKINQDKSSYDVCNSYKKYYTPYSVKYDLLLTHLMRYAVIYYLTILALSISLVLAADPSFYPQIEDVAWNITWANLQLPTDVKPSDISILSMSGSTADQKIITWTASRYDYELEWLGRWSKSHNTCAFHHQKKTYKMYRVTNLDNWKSVDCYNNDYMRREDRLVDLSSHAFRQIGSTRAGLLRVSVEPIE